MRRTILAIVLVLVIIFSIVAIVLLVDLEENEEEPEEILDKLYSFPISVGEETYVVTVGSNYSSAPEVSYGSYQQLLSCYISVDFRGDPENSYCNVTFPITLIWGSISLIAKNYEVDADLFAVSNNGTHYFVYFPFNHTALVKHFEIKGTRGVSENPSYYPTPRPQLTPELYEITDDYIRFYAFTIYSPLNKTYNSRFLTLNMSFTGGMGVRYSLYYHIDGEYVGDIPWSSEGDTELHVTVPAKGSTELPELSEGSHSLTVFLKGEGLVLWPSLYNGTVFFTIDPT